MGSNNDSVDVQDAMSDRVHDMFNGLLESLHGGWENNDGADGSFSWDLEQDHLVLKFGYVERVYREEEIAR